MKHIFLTGVFLFALITIASGSGEVTMMVIDKTAEEKAVAEIGRLSATLNRTTDPDARAVLLLARAHRLLSIDEQDLAAIDARKAWEDATHQSTRIGAGLVLEKIAYDRGAFDEALWYLAGAERKMPLATQERAMLGQCLLHTGQPATASEIFQSLGYDLPLQWPLREEAVAAEIRLGRIDKAREWFLRFQTQGDAANEAEGLLLAARIEYAAGDFKKAAALANQALEQSGALLPERQKALAAWAKVFSQASKIESLSLETRNLAATISPLGDFKKLPSDRIHQIGGVVQSRDEEYGSALEDLFLDDDDKLSWTTKAAGILRLTLRPINNDPQFLEGEIRARVLVKIGEQKYDLPLQLLPQARNLPTLEFENAYLSRAAQIWLPIGGANQQVELSVEGIALAVDITIAPLSLELAEGAQIDPATDSNPYDPFASLHKIAKHLQPGWTFKPEKALAILDELERGRPDLLWVAQLRSTLNRLIGWRRLWAVTHGEGVETADIVGTDYSPFLHLRDILAPCSFEPGTYTLLSPESSLRVVTRGNEEKSLTFRIETYNPYLLDEDIAAVGEASVELLVDNRPLYSTKIPLGRLMTFRPPPIPSGYRELRLRIGKVFSGTYSRVQILDADGKAVSPTRQRRFHVATKENPVSIRVKAPTQVHLRARWLHFSTGSKNAAMDLHVFDEAGEEIFTAQMPLPERQDTSATFATEDRAIGEGIRYALILDGTGRRRIEIAPTGNDPEMMLAVIPETQQPDALWVEPVSMPALTPANSPSASSMPQDKVEKLSMDIPWQRGGSFEVSSFYGQDDIGFSYLVDRDACPDCNRDYLDAELIHRIHFESVGIHQRAQIGLRDIFGMPAVERIDERLSWRTGLSTFRLVFQGRLYHQQLTKESLLAENLSLSGSLPIGNDLILFTPTLGFFQRGTNLKDPSIEDKQRLTPFVWSDYIQDNPGGARLRLSLASRPLRGMRIYANTLADSNADFTFSPPDILRPEAGLEFYAKGASISPYYQYTIYFEDDDRQDKYEKQQVALDISYGRFLPWGDRWAVFGRAGYVTTEDSLLYAIGLRYQWLRGRGVADFDPTLHPFIDRIEAEMPQAGTLERAR